MNLFLGEKSLFEGRKAHKYNECLGKCGVSRRYKKGQMTLRQLCEASTVLMLQMRDVECAQTGRIWPRSPEHQCEFLATLCCSLWTNP